MVYRTTPRTVTGYNPFFLVHGREARMPSELFDADISLPDLSEGDFVQEIVQGMSHAHQLAERKI